MITYHFKSYRMISYNIIQYYNNNNNDYEINFIHHQIKTI